MGTACAVVGAGASYVSVPTHSLSLFLVHVGLQLVELLVERQRQRQGTHSAEGPGTPQRTQGGRQGGQEEEVRGHMAWWGASSGVVVPSPET